MNDLLTNIKAIIIAQIRADQTVGRITAVLLNELLDEIRVRVEEKRPLHESEKIILFNELSNYFIADLNYDNDLVELERGLSITDNNPNLHTPWKADTGKRFYWKKQREFLMNYLGTRNGAEEASRIINSIDFETEEILGNMENPLRAEFDSRGLVVGYVQSGKTANFTALISKAADAGYRFIIILAGIHDELRQQTQIRTDRELTGHNNLNLDGSFVDWNGNEEPRRWNNLTSAGWLDGKETGEFSGKGINRLTDVFLSRERPVIAVIKKNVKIMNRLIKWISDSDEEDRINIPVLIIDDEADQASVDGNSNKEDTDPTKTNEKIRKILGLFKRTGYLGYTATPFANVFIQHDTDHDEFGHDLYPRNFIHSLPEPRGYFGTRRIFHDNLDKYFVSEIKDPKKEKKDLADRGLITADLSEAIYTFLIGIALRNLRGQSAMPMSMMINTDHRVTKMNRIGEMVQDHITQTLPDNYNLAELIKAYELYIKGAKILNDNLNAGNNCFTREEVINESIAVIKSRLIITRILNSNTKDKLDYAKEPSMKVIAIGGNKLSRGLTLEGLMITYYLRESKQFDTLLQMGRWFGYRKGYEDLVRIYTSKTLWRQFKDLAVVELEFREDIKQMAEEGKTPKEFAVAVRQILGLLPTAKNKLGAAKLENYYGGRQVSVTRLVLEKPEIIDANNAVTNELIENIHKNGYNFIAKSGIDYPSLLAEDIPYDIILNFLNSFIIATDTDGSSLEFDKNDLQKYVNIRLEKRELTTWNVAIISVRPNNDNNLIELPCDIKVRAINRARFKTSPVNGAYNIKALSGETDRKIDLEEEARDEYDGRKNPLLLLYVISRNSKPQQDREKSSREDLYLNIPAKKHRDPVSYSIIFPADNEGTGKYIQHL